MAIKDSTLDLDERLYHVVGKIRLKNFLNFDDKIANISV